jgi:glycosyltransferase involved in cell wall biosynthesis
MGPINPAFKNLAFKDSYLILAETLIAQQSIQEAVFLYNDDLDLGKKQGNRFKNIKLDSLNNLRNYLNTEYVAVFVRGNWQEHRGILKQLRYKKLFFYAADSYFWPRYIKKDACDYILADNRDQVKEVNLYTNKTKSFIFNKAVDTNVFKPQKLKKIYDFCYIANFRPWKNHNMLFSAMSKWQKKNSKPLKISLVGNLHDNLEELKILLWKYNIQADLFNSVSPQKVSQILNQSKFSVQAGELDANPRAISESLACDVPVLLNKDISGGAHLITKKTGLKLSIHKFDQGIDTMLRDYKKFKARDYFNRNLSTKNISSFFNI